VSAKVDTTGKWVWGAAKIVPGTAAALHVNGYANLLSISCASAANCVAGGYYSRPQGRAAFVAKSTKNTLGNAVWGKATDIPHMTPLDQLGNSKVTSVSCVSAGNCAAIGDYALYSVFVVGETNGVWGNAAQLPGLAPGSTPQVNLPAAAISCAKVVGTC